MHRYAYLLLKQTKSKTGAGRYSTVHPAVGAATYRI